MRWVSHCLAVLRMQPVSAPGKVLDLQPEQQNLQGNEDRSPVVLDVPTRQVHDCHQNLQARGRGVRLVRLLMQTTRQPAAPDKLSLHTWLQGVRCRSAHFQDMRATGPSATATVTPTC